MKTCKCGKKMFETWEEFGDPREPVCINCFLNPPDSLEDNEDEIAELEEEIEETEDEIQELERALWRLERELNNLKSGKANTEKRARLQAKQHEEEMARLKAWKAQ